MKEKRTSLVTPNVRCDGRTDGRTDRPSYRDAWTHLKTEQRMNERRRKKTKIKGSRKYRWVKSICVGELKIFTFGDVPIGKAR